MTFITSKINDHGLINNLTDTYGAQQTIEIASDKVYVIAVNVDVQLLMPNQIDKQGLLLC